IRGGGEHFKYPYTLFAKVQQFPFKFYWKHGRFFRFYFYTAALLLPCYAYLGKLTNAPANVKKWEEIRAKRR
ncbi:unnamed protein product, partial [Candidula unifasciata]